MFTIKQLNTKIRSVAKRNSVLRDDIQVIMCNIAGHAYVHGDVSAASNLLNAVVGQDKVAIVRFLRDHCFVNVKSDGSVSLNKSARKDADFVDGESCVQHLLENAPKWFEAAVSTEQAVAALDVPSRIAALTKQVAKGDREVKFNWDDLQREVDALTAALELARSKQVESEIGEALAA